LLGAPPLTGGCWGDPATLHGLWGALRPLILCCFVTGSTPNPDFWLDSSRNTSLGFGRFDQDALPTWRPKTWRTSRRSPDRNDPLHLVSARQYLLQIWWLLVVRGVATPWFLHLKNAIRWLGGSWGGMNTHNPYEMGNQGVRVSPTSWICRSNIPAHNEQHSHRTRSFITFGPS
jgi:hypothetical protein